jgi:hypothetical protein
VKTNTKKTKLPGASYLIPFIATAGPKCACKSPHMTAPSGAWFVEHADRFYAVSPSTQLQKDIWLGDAATQLGDKEKALAMLRWYCFTCKTVQAP